jgi:uncharacterized ferritin-like protein (DUF455 family)
MYKLTIETESLDELYATVSRLQGKATVSITGCDEEPKKIRKAKDKMANEIKEVVAEKNEEVDPLFEKRELPSGKSLLGYEDIKKATLELVSKQGKPAALHVLNKFGAQNAQQLKPEDFGKYVSEVNAVLAEAV